MPQGGGLDLGALMGIAQRARELQTQSAVSDAMRASGGDPGAALKGLMQPGAPGFMTPQIASDFSKLGQYYAEQVGKGAGSLYAKAISKSGASAQDFDDFATRASRYGVPGDVLASARREVVRPDGSLDASKLANIYGTISGGQQLPQQNYQTAGGVSRTAPAQSFLYGGPRDQGAAGGMGSATTTIPGAAGAAEQTGGASGKMLATARDASANYTQEVYPLKATIKSLEELGPNATGPGSEALNRAKSVLVFLGADKALGIDANKITDYQTANKYMIQWANTVSAAGTNDRLAAAIAGNPNMKMIQASNLVVAKSALALRRMQQAQLNEFEQTGLPEKDYARWAAQWNKTQDPRAYAIDIMGRDSADKMLKGMSPQERQRFETSLGAARRAGLSEGML